MEKKITNWIIVLAIGILSINSCISSKDKALTELLESDRDVYQASTLSQNMLNRIDDLWEKEYEEKDYSSYVDLIDSLLNSRYLQSANALSEKIKTETVHPQRLSKLYDMKGTICTYTQQPDSAIFFFRHAFINYPGFPEFEGHNKLWFYNNATMAMLEARRCLDTKAYYDSLIVVSLKFSDSLFYIGGKTRLKDFEKHIETICYENKN